MKSTLSLFAALAVSAFSNAADYTITIDGKSAEIDLDKEITFIGKDGSAHQVRIELKEYLDFSGDFFSIRHKNKFRPIRSDLGDGIHQTMINTPLGTGVIVQEYDGMNPELLISLMLKEITKEEVQYGYKYTESDVTKSVGGLTIKGKQAITTYGNEKWTRAVYAYGKGDKGVIIMTMIEAEFIPSDQHLIDDFWKYLSFKI